MKRNQQLGLALVGLLVLGATMTGTAALYSGFVNEFAPANWAISGSSYNPGAYVFTQSDTVLQINGSATADVSGSDTILTLQAPHPTHNVITLTFDWILTKNGNNGDPVAYVYVGTPGSLLHSYTLTGPSGSISTDVPEGTPISFELDSSVISGKSPAQFQVMNFGFDMVPEPGTWLAGVFLLGIGAFEACRWKHRAKRRP